MISTPLFGPSATKTSPDAGVISNGYLPNQAYPAEHQNYLMNCLTMAAVEITNFITDAGITLDPADQYQLEKALIAKRHGIGELVYSEIKQTPVIYSAAKSTTNPSYPQYNPVIARWDSDHDVTSAQAPDLVTAYRAEIATINVAGTPVSSWTGTVSGSTITFATNATNLALITMYANEANANGYIATQSATFSPVFTGTAQRCINVNGTDYAVTGCSTGAYTITVSGTPTTGSQTCIPYTYRVAGNATSVRLPRISGMVVVSAYDYDGVYISGWRKMDQMQGHWHNMYVLNPGGSGVRFITDTTSNGTVGVVGPVVQIRESVSDGNNGTPRTGKTTDPRAIGLLPYTWAGRLLA